MSGEWRQVHARSCRGCNCSLPRGFPHMYCNECYRRRQQNRGRTRPQRRPSNVRFSRSSSRGRLPSRPDNRESRFSPVADPSTDQFQSFSSLRHQTHSHRRGSRHNPHFPPSSAGGHRETRREEIQPAQFYSNPYESEQSRRSFYLHTEDERGNPWRGTDNWEENDAEMWEDSDDMNDSMGDDDFFQSEFGYESGFDPFANMRDAMRAHIGVMGNFFEFLSNRESSALQFIMNSMGVHSGFFQLEEYDNYPPSFDSMFSHMAAHHSDRIRPTPRTIAQRIPLVTVTRELENEACVICQEKYTRGSQANKLQCGHLFHRECLSPWLRTNDTCPVCRQTID